MALAEKKQENLPKIEKFFIAPSLLRITSNGIFVKGRPNFEQARVYEDFCAKEARNRHPDKFVISPQVVDKMAFVPESIFSGSRPDSLILQDLRIDDSCYTILYGMEEYKSGKKTNKKGLGTDYDLYKKAKGFNNLINKIEEDPGEIGRCLRAVLNTSFEKIPIDVDRVFVPDVVDVMFVTHNDAQKVKDKYKRLSLEYRTQETPIKYFRKQQEQMPSQAVVFQA